METEEEEEEESDCVLSCGFQDDISGLEGALNKVSRARERPDSLALEDKVIFRKGCLEQKIKASR